MELNSLPPLISPEILNCLLSDPFFNQKYRILEANFGYSAIDEFDKGHIINAVYFDVLNGVVPNKYFPRDLPSVEAFKDYCDELGISNRHHIIIYDRHEYGFYESSRAWFIFRLFGHKNVSILSEGFNGWRRRNYPLTDLIPIFPRENFHVSFRRHLVRSYEDIKYTMKTHNEQLIDSRPRADYFKANPKLILNTIPNSANVPYSQLFDPYTGTMKDIYQLWELFRHAGIDLNFPTTVFCNTGVTACSVIFAAYLLGARQFALYRGSWTEFSQRRESEVSRTYY